MSEFEASEGEDMFPEHPLFPFPDDEAGFDVSYIQVTRWENGKQVWGPTLPAGELQSELAVQELFGGGVYVLMARRPLKSDKSKPGSFTKSRKLTLPGKSRPLSTDPTPEEENPQAARVAAQPQANGLGLGGGGGVENLFLAMMTMQSQASERASQEARATAQREAENSKNFMTMFLGMMQNSKADTAAMMQMMMTLSSQQQNAMLQLLPTLIGARGGGPEEMAKFAELFKTLGFAQPANGKITPKDDDNSIGAILSNGADILQGFLALKGGVGAPAPEGAQPSALPAAAGSAQEMLERMRRG